MWQIRPEPFEVRECTTASSNPFSYWKDYPYVIESEVGPLPGAQIDPAGLRLVQLSGARTIPVRPIRRLNGKAIRAIWEHRKELPEHVWIPNMEKLPYTGIRTSSFALDGLRLRNPHGVVCMFYLCWTEGDVRWGITPIDYDRGPNFMRLVLEV